MNWGKGIVIVMGSFILFIGVLVSILIGQKVDLVSEEYYQNEIAYQNEIDAIQSATHFDSLKVMQKEQQLVFQFAKNIESDSVILKLWRPNDKKLDQSFSISGTEIFMIPINELQQGNYDIRCEYWMAGKNYLQKSKVRIE
jgi:hypothetical protein